MRQTSHVRIIISTVSHVAVSVFAGLSGHVLRNVDNVTDDPREGGQEVGGGGISEKESGLVNAGGKPVSKC